MQVRRTENSPSLAVPGSARVAADPTAAAGPAPASDTVKVKGEAAPSEGERLAKLRAAVEAAQHHGPEPAEERPTDDPHRAPAAQPSPRATGAAQGAAIQVAKQAMLDSSSHAAPYLPPQVHRPPYTGGAPALNVEQMDRTMVNNNATLRVAYSLEGRAPWVLKGYQFFTKVLGPIGAVANLAYSAFNAKKILQDPQAPAFLKGGIVTSTAMAGVSAAAAVRVGLHAWNLWPMATQTAVAVGKVAGVAGLGAGAVLSAMDTYNTFMDPEANAAQKGLSVIATTASVALPLTILLGLGGPIGIGLGVLAVGLPFAKNWLAKIPAVNHAFEAIGQALSPVSNGLGSLVGGARKLLGGVF